MQKLNTTAVYILSIVGFLCCCIGLGWIPALVALVLANKGLKKYNANPEMYENGKAMKSARTVAIISLVVSSLVAVYVLYIVIMLTTSDEYACEFWTKMIDGMQNNPSVTEEMMAPYYEMQEKACNNL